MSEVLALSTVYGLPIQTTLSELQREVLEKFFVFFFLMRKYGQ